jgi:preprotein translocase subunit SecA
MVKVEVTRVLMTVKIESNTQIEQAAQDLEERAEKIHNVTYTAPNESGEAETTMDATTFAEKFPVVGRNEPCPCGSGKKFKFCHGQLS